MKKNLILTFLCLLSIHLLAQTGESTRRSDRKLIEIKKVISLTEKQEEIIREAYEYLSHQKDSILYEVQDPIEAARLSRITNKEFHNTFMKTLSDSQRTNYIMTTCTPEVEEKAEVKIDELRNTGEYDEVTLATEKKRIFNYLMLEKVVYSRDKYDYKKQKENIAQLVKLRPSSLKKANTAQKLRIQGTTYKGKVQW